jgi:hypothetical protein
MCKNKQLYILGEKIFTDHKIDAKDEIRKKHNFNLFIFSKEMNIF